MFMIQRILLPIDTRFVFTRLQKLCLIDIDSGRLEEIFIYLISSTCIISLIINCMDNIFFISDLYHQIFRLPTLKYCKLSFKTYTEWLPLPATTTKFSPIEYLVIDHPINLNVLNNLLLYVPQLRRLHLTTTLTGPITSHPVTLNQLTHVSLNLQNFSFRELDLWFKNISNKIQVIHILIQSDKEYLDASRWEQLISSSMPYLRIFDIVIRCKIQYDENIVQCTAQMDQFNSWFWIERQWFFEYQVHQSEYENIFLLYSTNSCR
jgi:hypothetical protein